MSRGNAGTGFRQVGTDLSKSLSGIMKDIGGLPEDAARRFGERYGETLPATAAAAAAGDKEAQSVMQDMEAQAILYLGERGVDMRKRYEQAARVAIRTVAAILAPSVVLPPAPGTPETRPAPVVAGRPE